MVHAKIANSVRYLPAAPSAAAMPVGGPDQRPSSLPPAAGRWLASLAGSPPPGAVGPAPHPGSASACRSTAGMLVLHQGQLL